MIAVVDDHDLFRSGVCKVLSGQIETQNEHVEVFCSPHSLIDFLNERANARVVLVLCSSFARDIGDVRNATPSIIGVIVIADRSWDYSGTAQQLGADVILDREVDVPTFKTIVGKILNGRPVGDWAYVVRHRKGTANKEIDEKNETSRKTADGFTPTETAIVIDLMEGYKNREIAERLGTTEQVIKNCLRRIYDKTGHNSRLELAMWIANHPLFMKLIYEKNEQQKRSNARRSTSRIPCAKST
jgi:DNA-binding NarL/FixJ family response regulator